VIARCHDLHHANGLGTVHHVTPSAIDVETLRHCAGGLTDEFLLGIGIDAEELERLRTAGAVTR
jgi:hypothetical protein